MCPVSLLSIEQYLLRLASFCYDLYRICYTCWYSVVFSAYLCMTYLVPWMMQKLSYLQSRRAKLQSRIRVINCILQKFSAPKEVAEHICIFCSSLFIFKLQGLRQPPSGALDETEAIILATEWKRRVVEHRQQHTLQASKDALGLRKVTQCNGGPTLTQIMS